MLNAVLASILFLVVSPAGDPPLVPVEVGGAFPDFDEATWKGIDPPFDKSPSGRYTLLAFYSVCDEPTEAAGARYERVAGQLRQRDVDVVALTVLEGTKATKKVRAAGIDKPWVSLEYDESSQLGFPTSKTNRGVLVDPCGEVVWLGSLAALEAACDDLAFDVPGMPRAEDWPGGRDAKAVRRAFDKGRLADACLLARASEDDALREIGRTLETIIEGRLDLCRKRLDAGDLATVERLVDLLDHQLDEDPWEERVDVLADALKQAKRNA